MTQFVLDNKFESDSKIKFSIEEEVFDYEFAYDELEMAVNDCKPDHEVTSTNKVNSSIR